MTDGSQSLWKILKKIRLQPLKVPRMKKYLVSCVFVIISQYAFNQVITGIVADEKDKRPIELASVYINGTFVGTHSDQNGHFELDVSRYKSMPLTVSALGYYSTTISGFSASRPLLILMKTKIFEMNEVVITDKSLLKVRRRYLRVFEDEFLGTTPYADGCTIINEDDIKFIYNGKSDTLKAYALNPIIVENYSLGYKITYFLDEFEFDRRQQATLFTGNILFNEDLTVTGEQQELFKMRRETAYRGSRMQFIRSLWNNSFESAGYIIRDQSGHLLTYNKIVTETDSASKFIKYREDLMIFFKSNLPSGYIHFKEDAVEIDRDGYFNPYGIQWSGHMADQRIADWLPYEYNP
jgi:hypothetical protein